MQSARAGRGEVAEGEGGEDGAGVRCAVRYGEGGMRLQDNTDVTGRVQVVVDAAGVWGGGVGCFFFNDRATTENYTLSLHDALPS